MRNWYLATAIITSVFIIITVMMMSAHLLVVDFVISFPADFDAIALVFGITIIAFTAMIIALKRGMDTIRQQSVRLAREEAFAEHRRFLHYLDHELKNPLTAIRAGLANLSELQGDEQQAVLASVESQIIRLSRLVADLRKLAELETQPLELSSIDLAQLASEVVELTSHRPEARERTLTLTLPQSSLAPINADYDLMLLAIHNLLDNALRFTHTGDQIQVTVSEEENQSILSVTDNGIGIPEEEIPLVWEELYRGRGASHLPGNGIGLALVQLITQRHKGVVELQSHLSQGTTVTICIPQSQ